MLSFLESLFIITVIQIAAPFADDDSSAPAAFAAPALVAGTESDDETPICDFKKCLIL